MLKSIEENILWSATNYDNKIWQQYAEYHFIIFHNKPLNSSWNLITASLWHLSNI